MVNKGQGEIAEVRHADRRDYAVDVDDVDAMLGGIGGAGGAKIAQSQTRRDQRGGQKCLSLSRQKWMEHAKVCVLQNAKTFANEKTFRNGIEQERPAPSRRWEVNI